MPREENGSFFRRHCKDSINRKVNDHLPSSLVLKPSQSSDFVSSSDNVDKKIPSVAATASSSLDESSAFDVDDAELSQGVPAECYISNIDKLSIQDDVSPTEGQWTTSFIVERPNYQSIGDIQHDNGQHVQRLTYATRNSSVLPITPRQKDTPLKQKTNQWEDFKSDCAPFYTLRAATSNERRQDIHTINSSDLSSTGQISLKHNNKWTSSQEAESTATGDSSLLASTTCSVQDEPESAITTIDRTKGCKLFVEILHDMKEIFVDSLFEPDELGNSGTLSEDISIMSSPGDVFWDTPDIEVQVLPDFSSVSEESFINHSGSSTDDSEYDINESSSSTFLNHKVSWQRRGNHDCATQVFAEKAASLGMKERSDGVETINKNEELCGNKSSCDERDRVCFCRLWRFHSQLENLEKSICMGTVQDSLASNAHAAPLQLFDQDKSVPTTIHSDYETMMPFVNKENSFAKIRKRVDERGQRFNYTLNKTISAAKQENESQRSSLLHEEIRPSQYRAIIPHAHIQRMIYEGRRNFCKTLIKSRKQCRHKLNTFHKKVAHAATSFANC